MKITSYQSVGTIRIVGILGLFLFVTIFCQIITGIMLSFSLSNDPMLVPIVRNTEDLDAPYIDDFFWLHERGVDCIFIFLFFHLWHKLFIKSHWFKYESAWIGGSTTFLVIHFIIFTGLVLCCTHLSEVTLKIAVNVIHTLVNRFGDFTRWIFPGDSLNSDTLIRIMYLHYVIPFILIVLAINHMVDMHPLQRSKNKFDTRRVTYYWYTEVLKKEMYHYMYALWWFFLVSFVCFFDNEPLSYELFMWGDLGIMTDVRFLSVAPHWYFRAYMSWLIFSPHHYIGLFGILYFFIAVVLFPQIHRSYQFNLERWRLLNVTTHSCVSRLIDLYFFISCLYVISYLPYGRCFCSLNGNNATSWAFGYIYLYISFPLHQIWRSWTQKTIHNWSQERFKHY